MEGTEEEAITWVTEHGTVLHGKSIAKNASKKSTRQGTSANKWALIDFDGTIVKPRDGRKRARKDDVDDWQWAFPTVKSRIRELHSQGFTIVIVSNQKGGINNVAWRQKANNVIAELDIPLEIYAATGADCFRKPCTGIIGLIQKKEGEHVHGHRDGNDDDIINPGDKCQPLPEGSFFCGDAAGRKGDFADTDRKFAINAELDFYTPEDLFMQKKKKHKNGEKGEEEPYRLNYPNIRRLVEQPSSYISCMIRGNGVVPCTSTDKKKRGRNIARIRRRPTIHLMVGMPGSGKSWFAKYFFAVRGCDYISADVLGGVPKCLKMATSSMNREGRQHDIVVDNTNLDIATREKWIKLAHANEYRIVCYNIDTPMDVCRHNMAFRGISGGKIVPEHVMRIMAHRYKPPTKTEGFATIIRVPFAIVGMSPDQLMRYCQYLY